MSQEVNLEEIEYAIRMERMWRERTRKSPDLGDYENPAGPDCSTASRVTKAYRELVDALLERQRS